MTDYFRDDLGSICPVPSRCGFLDQDYRYKSVETQIPHDSGLHRSSQMEILSKTDACAAVTLTLAHGGGILILKGGQIYLKAYNFK